MAKGLLVKSFNRSAGALLKGFAETGTGTPGLTPGVASLTGHTQTTLSLSATDATGGTSPYSHQWQRALSLLGPFINVGADSLTIADSGLTPGTTYYYRLVYIDAAIISVQSNIVSGVTDPLGAGTLPLGVHPDYVIEWEPPTVFYQVGERRPLKWTVTRKDGQAVDEPSAGQIVVTLPDGSQSGTLTPDIESATATTPQTVAVDYTFTQSGTYLAEITLQIGDEVISRTDRLYVA